MGHRRRATGWIGCSILLGIWSAGFGMGLPGTRLEGERAIAATPATLTSWHFNTDSQQLEVVLPGGTTPRYFLLAQPARIVVDLPSVAAGAVAGEQTYGGAIRRVRVAQFEPGLTRIVMELNPDAELAPGQVELARAETLANGETRWTLRPLLVGMAPDQPSQNEPFQDDVATNPTSVPLAPPLEPPPAITPTTVDPINTTESTVSAVPEPALQAPPLETVVPDEEVAITTPPPQPDPSMDMATDGADVAVSPPQPEPVMDMAIPDVSGAAIAVPPLEPTPNVSQPTVDAEPEPMLDRAIPETGAIAVTVPPLSPSELSSTGEPAEPPIITEPPLLSDETSMSMGQGAEFLAPEPAGIPVNPTTPLAESTDETLTSTTFPDAVDIPIDFPSPNLPEGSHSGQSFSTVLPSVVPSEDSPAIVVPSLEAPVPVMEPTSIAAAPTQPDVLIPAGETLRLRYPRTSSLELADQPWQEVLVLANPVQDSQGAVLVPEGTQVIGRFERDGRGYRFVAQAIALNDEVFLLQGASERFRDNSIEPNTVFEVDIDQELRSPTP